VPIGADGEKHPSERAHTERLVRLQAAVHRCVMRNLGRDDSQPVLRAEISAEKADDLRQLHRLCDWVITLDRNAGIEYFDSPRDNKEIYDAYVIDCVPEREDLGCLQLITSTANLEEVRNLLDSALDQMGLSRSRRNAEFLMEHLKALSGRLAIRLTGQKPPTSELIALAISHAHCRTAAETDECWTSLESGFFIPVDDIRDLLPPLAMPRAGRVQTEEPSDAETGRGARPDLIYVSLISRRGLQFRFIEVKYRRHLRTARSPEILEKLRTQVESLRQRWDEWYEAENVPSVFRAVRRAKLARVLRFYADKAQRHYLQRPVYEALVSEIDRMVAKGGDYSFAITDGADRGWAFCPEYAGTRPLEITPPDCSVRIFLFGPALLPDSAFRRESIAPPKPPTEPSPPDRTVVSAREDHPAVERAGEGDVSPSSKPTEQVPKAPGPSGRLPCGAERDQDARPHAPKICFGKDVLTGADVSWTVTVEGNPHLLVAGLPGMGKTTCLLNVCRQMLEANIRPIVFSYHQDIDQKLQTIVGSVRFIDFQGLGFNPLHVLDRQSPMAYLDVAGAIRDIFVAIYPELGDIQGERIRRAVKESFVECGWADPDADRARLNEPPFARFVEILRSNPRPDKGLKTLLARLEELEDYGFFQPGRSQESLWDCDQPIVIRIHITQNDNLQKAFASLVFYGLYKDMFRRGPQNRITHALIFDEAHRAARLRLIPTMAKECRKYGISLVLASQEARDFNISLFSAIANYLVLGLNEADAKVLVRNVASSDQERLLIDKIKQMDKFKALYFCEGKKKPSMVALCL